MVPERNDSCGSVGCPAPGLSELQHCRIPPVRRKMTLLAFAESVVANPPSDVGKPYSF